LATRLNASPFARFIALVELVRPVNLAAMALAAWVGARIGRAPVDAGGIFVPVLIGVFGYALNDASDLAADRFNRPDRPLPRGALSPRTAKGVAWLGLLGAAILVALSRRDVISISIAGVAALVLAAYSPWLKERGAVGPSSIALLTVLAVAWGSVGGTSPERVVLPSLLAGAVQFARECVKHLEDAPGDRAAGRTTWVVRSGGPAVILAARLGVLAALLLLPLPATVGGVRPLYLAAAFPTAGLLLLGTFIALGGAAPPYRRVSAMLKLSLFCGLAALAIAA